MKSNSNLVITGYSVSPITQQITSLEVNGEKIEVSPEPTPTPGTLPDYMYNVKLLAEETSSSYYHVMINLKGEEAPYLATRLTDEIIDKDNLVIASITGDKASSISFLKPDEDYRVVEEDGGGLVIQTIFEGEVDFEYRWVRAYN